MTDRELDAAVAERLFGLDVVENHGQLVVKRTIGFSENAPDVPIWVAEPIPDYATWEGMGLVIEAMEAKGYYWEAGCTSNPQGRICCEFELITVGVGGRSFLGFADTAPRAVRLAAARALGVSDE